MDKKVSLSKSAKDGKSQEDLILRDRLALVRTKLANERTLFSYIRTSLYLLTVGVGILEIKSIAHLKLVAYVCLVSSGFLFVLGWLKFYKLDRRLQSYGLTKTQSGSTSPNQK